MLLILHSLKYEKLQYRKSVTGADFTDYLEILIKLRTLYFEWMGCDEAHFLIMTPPRITGIAINFRKFLY